ncbi:MAG: hypothetical protein ACUVTY_14665 [Armatimonadota bacterium]
MVQTVEKTPDVHIVRRRFTPGEYHRMAEIGLFDGERVELIEGEVVKMSPIGPAHQCARTGCFCVFSSCWEMRSLCECGHR